MKRREFAKTAVLISGALVSGINLKSQERPLKKHEEIPYVNHHYSNGYRLTREMADPVIPGNLIVFEDDLRAYVVQTTTSDYMRSRMTIIPCFTSHPFNDSHETMEYEVYSSAMPAQQEIPF